MWGNRDLDTLRLLGLTHPLYTYETKICYAKQSSVRGVIQYEEAQNIPNVTDTYTKLLQDKSCFIDRKIQQIERVYLT